MRDIGTRTADMSCSLDKIILATDQLIGDLFIYTLANFFLGLCRKDTGGVLDKDPAKMTYR